MKRFEIDVENGVQVIDLPTKLEEITSEYLLNVTQEVNIADNYSLVAIVTIEKLSVILSVLKNPAKQDTTKSSVVPLFVKSGITDNNFINSIKTGEKVIISGGSLSMGFNVTAVNNELNLIDITTFLKDKVKNVFEDKNKYCFLSFKLVPNCDIKGVYTDNICKKENAYVRLIPRHEELNTEEDCNLQEDKQQ